MPTPGEAPPAHKWRYILVSPSPGAATLDAVAGASGDVASSDRFTVILLKSYVNSSGKLRSTACQKLTRLTKHELQELSMDVFKELVRRKKDSGENDFEGVSSFFLM